MEKSNKSSEGTQAATAVWFFQPPRTIGTKVAWSLCWALFAVVTVIFVVAVVVSPLLWLAVWFRDIFPWPSDWLLRIWPSDWLFRNASGLNILLKETLDSEGSLRAAVSTTVAMLAWLAAFILVSLLAFLLAQCMLQAVSRRSTRSHPTLKSPPRLYFAVDFDKPQFQSANAWNQLKTSGKMCTDVNINKLEPIGSVLPALDRNQRAAKAFLTIEKQEGNTKQEGDTWTFHFRRDNLRDVLILVGWGLVPFLVGAFMGFLSTPPSNTEGMKLASVLAFPGLVPILFAALVMVIARAIPLFYMRIVASGLTMEILFPKKSEAQISWNEHRHWYQLYEWIHGGPKGQPLTFPDAVELFTLCQQVLQFQDKCKTHFRKYFELTPPTAKPAA